MALRPVLIVLIRFCSISELRRGCGGTKERDRTPPQAGVSSRRGTTLKLHQDSTVLWLRHQSILLLSRATLFFSRNGSSPMGGVSILEYGTRRQARCNQFQALLFVPF